MTDTHPPLHKELEALSDELTIGADWLVHFARQMENEKSAPTHHMLEVFCRRIEGALERTRLIHAGIHGDYVYPWRAFSANLARLRARKGYSQESLAHEAGISRTTISKLECAQTAPQGATVRRLAAALGVEVEELTSP